MPIRPRKQRLRGARPSPAFSDSAEPRTWAVHLSPDDRYLAVINRDGRLQCWLSVHRLDGGRLL